MKVICAMLIFCLLVITAFLPGCVSPPPQETPEVSNVSESSGVSVTPEILEASSLMFVTEEYPPFNYIENGTIQGIAVDLLRGVAKEMGDVNSADNIMVVPWSKAWATTLERNNTVLFATVRLPEREELFKWAGPLGSERKVIFAGHGKSPEIKGPDDLAGYRIGVVRDDAACEELLALGVGKEQLVEMGNVPALISLIQDGEIDLWCYGDLAGRYFAEKETGDPDYFDIVYTLDTNELYYAFNRATPDSVVQVFQDTLGTLRYKPDETGVTEYQRIAYRYIGVSCLSHPPVTANQVTALVNFTAEALEKDAPGTLARINGGEHPFWDRDNRALYVFVYDTNVTIVAEADNPRLIGVNMRGKTDIAGIPFRDIIIKKALAEGTGWVDYIWMIPEENGTYHKSTFFRLAKGSDNNRYIVASGIYIPCKQD